MTFKITTLNERVHALSNELPADEVVVEDQDGELIHIDEITYNAMTGYVHIKLGKSLDDEDDDE